jgi:hypothetical protein
MFSFDAPADTIASISPPYTLKDGETDPRLLNLSYSSLLTAHSCPRRFELEKRGATSDVTEHIDDTITFSYGHVVGLGIQLVLEKKEWEEVVWRCALAWTAPLWAENPKQNKSFAQALFAVQKFRAMLTQGYLDGFSLVVYNGAPACELSFLINLPNNYKYRGFVDAVLQHDETGKVIVLECKTSSATNLNPAQYRNSAQAIGYSIVLDAIFPDLSSYEVLYLVYSSKQLEYTQYPFEKSYVQRARWIQELVLDCEILALYESRGVYPMRGESCFDYYRECKYLGLCQMETDKFTEPLTQDGFEKIQKSNSEYQIQISLDDLIHAQLHKAELS